ncbi:MAG: serine/threonine-protein kinase [Gemmataceae bacterium]|nr:serine/threonine-protein kinase [Gemmataceae bacterium]
MSHCPSPEQLERLLAEQFSGPEYETVAAHIETCASCQEQLELLVGNPVAPFGQRRSGRRADPVHEPDDAFLQRLRQTPPPRLVASSDRNRPPSTVVPELEHTERVASDAQDRPELGCLGQYQLLDKLGAGGMGTVYKARHRELEKIVALKVLPAELMNEVSLARFKNEMKAVGKLEHPNIVGAHDAGQVDGTHFLVMDFVDGMDLARLVERHGGLRLADACELIRQAAAGLQHAYERGLVHRDIKPSNLMLARNGLVKVLDLGLARSFGEVPIPERLTATGLILGTADYIAPEQCEAAHTVDIRADIYSLGCSLYHLLSGTPPFGGARYSSWLQKMRAHLETPVPPLQKYRPEVPAELVAVLERMLAKNPADRFATPIEVATALQPFAIGSDLPALLEPGSGNSSQANLTTQPGPRAATARWMRYSRRVAALASLCLLLLAALIFWPGGWNIPAFFEKDARQSPAIDGRGQPLRIQAMEVRHFRGEEAKPMGEIGTTSETIRRDDDVRVEVRLSAPAYCYLIALNPDGTEQLCYPESADGDQARATPPARSAVLRFPQGEGDVFGLDAAGLQAFVLVASAQPLPAYAAWQSQAGKIPWEPAKADRVWRFEGQTFVPLPRERGTVRQRGGPPKALSGLGDFFKDRPEFAAVQILAFPVTAD